MKIAITIWEDRVSPLFDSSRQLLVAEVDGSEIITKNYQHFNPDQPNRLAHNLKEMDVNVFICGAVSEVPARLIASDGVTLIPFISGKADEVLSAYIKGLSIVNLFSMPGCGKNRGRCRKKSQYSGLSKNKCL